MKKFTEQEPPHFYCAWYPANYVANAGKKQQDTGNTNYKNVSRAHFVYVQWVGAAYDMFAANCLT